MPENAEPKLDQTIPGGAYIVGGEAKDGKHYGGKVVNSEGEVLGTFADGQENPGAAGFAFDPEKGKVAPVKPKALAAASEEDEDDEDDAPKRQAAKGSPKK